MTKEKIIEVVDGYKDLLNKKGIVSQEIKDHGTQHSEEEKLSHLCYMLGRIEDFVQSDELGKANRWLGFVQGTLNALDISTLEELKNDNRPD